MSVLIFIPRPEGRCQCWPMQNSQASEAFKTKPKSGKATGCSSHKKILAMIDGVKLNRSYITNNQQNNPDQSALPTDRGYNVVI